MIPWLPEDETDAAPGDTALAPFPPTAQALGPETDAAGLLCAGGTLSVARLRLAYAQGIFPWFSPGQPVLWWTTNPRMVLKTADFKLHRSLRKTLQHFIATPGCEVRIDSAFDRVIAHCSGVARPGQDGTWIVPEVAQAYCAWHRTGQVHSFETWIDGELVGGLYGVNLGRMFFGESMFALRPDASKIALAALVAFCRAHDMPWIDCQQQTAHLATLGAAPVARAAFEAHLQNHVNRQAPQGWFYDPAVWVQLDLRLPPAVMSTP